MKTNLSLLRRKRIIKRIVESSEIYNEEYLNGLSTKSLLFIQKSTFIELMIKLKYKSRHDKSKSIFLFKKNG